MEVHGFGGRCQEPICFHSPIFSVLFHTTDNQWEEILLNRTEHISTAFPMVEWNPDKIDMREREIYDNMTLTCQEPEILISARHFWKLFQGKREISPGLFVIQTTLGPVLNGETDITSKTPNLSVSLVSIHNSNIDQMPTVNEIEHFFKLESIGINDNPEEKDDETAIKLFNRSIRRETDGRYSVKWPWRESNPNLPSNFGMAHSRLSSVLTRLRHTPELLAEYDAIFQDQLDKGIIEPAERNPGQLEHYLPHHGVIQPHKKLRIVYDASAHSKGELSLNNCLYRGPILLPDLAGMLLRFRCPKYPLLADIQAAFLNIGLESEDREVAKFLWLKDIDKPLTPKNMIIYRFKRVAFGVISSPFLLAATLQHHLKSYNLPLARELEKSLYVDNALLECEKPEECLAKCILAKSIFKDAHFNLREFLTNSKEAMANLPEEDRINKTKAKVLGLTWDTENDEILYSLPITDPSKPVTRRSVLSHMASLFDPLGHLSPIILNAKLLFQTLWDGGHGWDDVLSDEDCTRWNLLQETWRDQSIIIPRRTLLSDFTQIQLHGFVDASIHTFATAIYLRCESKDQIQTWLIYSKNRLKPKNASKALTIPRLELLALLIGTRALKFVSEHLNRPIYEFHIWSDSQIALSWVKSQEIQPVFVERRLKEIRGFKGTFHYVRTNDNPADIATRGMYPNELRECSLWWKGPFWLPLPSSLWPEELKFKSVEIVENHENMIPEPEVTFIAHDIPRLEQGVTRLVNAERISSWPKLLRITIYCLRFLNHLFHKRGKIPTNLAISSVSSDGPLLSNDILVAEELIIRLDQLEHENELNRYSILKNEDGILRLKTRLGKSNLPISFSHPIILGKYSVLNPLLIFQCHQKCHHLGTEATLTEFLTKYWVPHARMVVKRTLKNCKRCQSMKSYPYALPTMPSLPAERVQRQVPFQAIGMDFLGPTLTKISGKKTKIWIILITCMATRAVYLEAMLNTTADCLLNVFRRFISRRGKPDIIWSDNATSFKLAERTLKVLTKPRNSQEADNFLAINQIKWRFIAQLSPWSGGFYERLVGLVKTCFRRTLGRKILEFDQFNTFIAEVEATLNHRPITAVSDAKDGLMALRPINLIQPEIMINWEINSDNIDELPDSSHTRLAARVIALREANEIFWERWHREYLLLLRERSSWDHKGPRLQNRLEPKKGMIVLIGEDYIPRNQWALGKIIELHGNPGSIRSVTVEIPIRNSSKKRGIKELPRKSILTRPVNRIYPLEAGPELTESLPTQPIIPALPTNPRRKLLDPNLEIESSEEDYTDSNTNIIPGKPINSSSFFICNHKSMPILTILGLILLTLPISLSLGVIGRNRRFPVGRCVECKLKCSTNGLNITVPPDIRYVEICCEGICSIQPITENLPYFLPRDILLHPYECKGRFWTEIHHVLMDNIFCPAIDECLLIKCSLCFDHIINPSCDPKLAVISATAYSFATLSLIFIFYPVIKHIILGFSLIVRILSIVLLPCHSLLGNRTRRRTITEEGQELVLHPRHRNSILRPSRKWTNRRLGQFVSFVLIIFIPQIPSLAEEAGTIAIMTKSENCLRNGHELTCTIENSVTLTLLPAGQINTLLIKTEDGNNLGSIQITLRSLVLECQDFTKSWLRSFYIANSAVKRCPYAGTCEPEICSKVRTNTSISELAEVSNFPGLNFCIDSTAFWGNNCFFGNFHTGACLFYRLFAKPRSHLIYELIACNTWEFGIYAYIQLEATIGKNAAGTSVETILRPGLTMKFNNISFTPLGVTHPPSPLLNANFLFDGKKMALLRNPLPELIHCPNQVMAKSFNCTLSPQACINCNANHDNGSVSCDCHSLNLESLINDPLNLLPLDFFHHSIRHINRKPIALASYSPVQIHISLKSVRFALELRENFCTISLNKLSGCYLCSSGANMDFSCQATHGSTVAYVECEDNTKFSTKCTNTLTNYTKILSFNHSEISTKCRVICSAGITNFSLFGLLHYIPLSQRINFETSIPQKINIANTQSWFNWSSFDWSILPLSDIKNTISSLFDFRPIILFIIGSLFTLSSLFLLLIFIKFPCGIWKLIIGVLIIQSVCAPVAGGSFGEDASGGIGKANDIGEMGFGEGALPTVKIFSISTVKNVKNSPIIIPTIKTILLIKSSCRKFVWGNGVVRDRISGTVGSPDFIIPNSYKTAHKSSIHSLYSFIPSILPTNFDMPFQTIKKPWVFKPISKSKGNPWSPISDKPKGNLWSPIGETSKDITNIIKVDDENTNEKDLVSWGPTPPPLIPEGLVSTDQKVPEQPKPLNENSQDLDEILEEYFGCLNLGDWIINIHGKDWYLYPEIRRKADISLKEALEKGALIVTTHLETNQIVQFDGFSQRGAGKTEMYPGRTIFQYYKKRGIDINYTRPCIQQYGGYSNRLNYIHISFFPLEILNLRFKTGIENIDPLPSLPSSFGNLQLKPKNSPPKPFDHGKSKSINEVKNPGHHLSYAIKKVKADREAKIEKPADKRMDLYFKSEKSDPTTSQVCFSGGKSVPTGHQKKIIIEGTIIFLLLSLFTFPTVLGKGNHCDLLRPFYMNNQNQPYHCSYRVSRNSSNSKIYSPFFRHSILFPKIMDDSVSLGMESPDTTPSASPRFENLSPELVPSVPSFGNYDYTAYLGILNQPAQQELAKPQMEESVTSTNPQENYKQQMEKLQNEGESSLNVLINDLNQRQGSQNPTLHEPNPTPQPVEDNKSSGSKESGEIQSSGNSNTINLLRIAQMTMRSTTAEMTQTLNVLQQNLHKYIQHQEKVFELIFNSLISTSAPAFFFQPPPPPPISRPNTNTPINTISWVKAATPPLYRAPFTSQVPSSFRPPSLLALPTGQPHALGMAH